MKRRFLLLTVPVAFLALGAAFSLISDSGAMGLFAADSSASISEICGSTRIAGSNSKTFIAISAKETIGTYGASYCGTVYDANGNPLPLTLKQNGGATGSWIGSGTRRFELRTDESAFLEAIGTGTTFTIGKNTVFEGTDTNIRFEKVYQFTSIYDGNFKITEVSESSVSFAIEEVETRLSTTEFRVGATNFVGLAAGFEEVFTGKAVDLDGNEVGVSISDCHAGSTGAGNRRVMLRLDSPVKDNAFLIHAGASFSDALGIKKLTLPYAYFIKGTDFAFCDGETHHIFTETVDDGSAFVSSCLECHQEVSTPIFTVKAGSQDPYCQTTKNETQAEVLIKMGGCEGYDADQIASVYRGKCKLNNVEANLKISISGSTLRFYLYLPLDHACVSDGEISISKEELFVADGDLSYLRFAEGMRVTYHSALHKYRVDPLNYEFVESEVSDLGTKNWCSSSNEEVAISFFNPSLGNDVVVPEGKTLIYRGKGKVQDEEPDVRIVLTSAEGKTKLALFFQGGNQGLFQLEAGSKLFLDSAGTTFEQNQEKIADTLSFPRNITLNYDADNNLVNPKETVLSLSGTGSWSQPIETSDYNVMCSFVDCHLTGLSQDQSQIHPETLEHRGYHFYGIGYDKTNEEQTYPVDIWVSSFSDGDDELSIATVKTAIYCNMPSSGSRGAIKLHQGDSFVSPTYNMTLKLDADYLVKWYSNSSRTTAGKYNDDHVGPTIRVDTNSLFEFTEGEEKPTLPVSVEDDVDDIVALRAQTWQEGALDSSNCLVAGEWNVTLTAKDAAGNEAVPVVIQVKVNPKESPSSSESSSSSSSSSVSGGGCNSFSGTGIVFGLLAIAGFLFFVIKK